MITKYIKGNLLDHDGPIAHGCNAQGKMNSGVAKAIRETYPKAYTDYVDFINNEAYSAYDEFVCKSVDTDTGKTIFNLITQPTYGYDGGRYVNYANVARAFADLEWNYSIDHGNSPLGIPKIGAGLGGGDWSILEQIINDATPNLEIWVYEL